MTLALGFKGGVLGFGVESAWGTAVARTKFIEFISEGVSKEIEPLHSGAIAKRYFDDDEFAQGAISVGGEIEFEMRYEGMETLLKNALGTVTTAETASFIVVDSGATQNNKLDFNIGAGELTATVAAGTYAAGTTQATADSLCKAIYDAIVAVEATGTYTVSFSTTTKLFTITRSAGTFQILWNTGTNKSDGIAALIGFATTADDTGALTYSSDTALVPVFTHTFTTADELPTGLTFEIDRDTTAFILEGGIINTLAMSCEAGGFLKATMGIVAEDETTGTVTSATLPTAGLVTFVQGAVTYGGSAASVTACSFTVNNNMKTDRRFIGSRLIKAPQPNGKTEVTGTFTIEFEDTNAYTDFIGATSRALVLTFTSTATIKTGHYYTITITFPAIKLTGAAPKISDAGPIMLELPFRAFAQDSSTREMTIAVKNALAAVV